MLSISTTFRRAALLSLMATAARCQTGLAEASLEQLLNVRVTSVSKKEQKLSRAAAAVFVISQEDIRRSGATNLPDLLRMAPGVDVAQIDANAWAITIRGFNSRYANKVMVLVDSRLVYSASFNGTYWDHLDMPLEDIERIEVIRGPGATIWGANAVNGVVNIITKSSKATRGGLATATAGAEVKTGLLRYGGGAPFGPASGGTYRVFAKYSRIGDAALPDGANGADGWSRVHGGFRSDWDLSARDFFTLQGDLFANRGSQTRRQWFLPVPFDPPFAQDVNVAAGNLLSRWNHASAGGSDTSVQAYYDTYRRDDMGQPEAQKTFDLNIQHHVTAGSRHDIVFGLGYRVITSATPPGYQIAFSPAKRTDPLYSAFFQDEIRVANTFWLTLGAKLEHNAYTGYEYAPSVRLAWAPTPRHAFWAAASRATSQPSRLQSESNIELARTPLNPYTILSTRLYGNPHFQSEDLRDYEMGYRAQWVKSVSLDMATFLSFYRRLQTFDPQAPVVVMGSTGVLIQVPLLFGNNLHSLSYGGELALNWNVNPRWRVSPEYSFLHLNARLDPSSRDQMSLPLAGNTPRHMFQIRSFLNLTKRLEWDHTLYWTQRMTNGNVPSHARLDSRIGWRAGESAEISIVGQNLLRPRFLEFGDSFEIVGTQTQRSIFGRITWTF